MSCPVCGAASPPGRPCSEHDTHAARVGRIRQDRGDVPAQFYEDGYEACLGDVIRVLRGDAPREWLGPTPEAQPDHRTLIGSGPREKPRGWSDEKRVAYLLGMYEAADLIEQRFGAKEQST